MIDHDNSYQLHHVRKQSYEKLCKDIQVCFRRGLFEQVESKVVDDSNTSPSDELLYLMDPSCRL